MDLPLVVGVDGSEPSLRAVDWAADEAALRGVPLRLVYASLWGSPHYRLRSSGGTPIEGAALATGLGSSSEQMLADSIVEAAAKRAQRRASDVKISTEVLPEEPVPALLREGSAAFALVLGSRGRGGIAELLLGSVSLAVASRADCPVIVLRGSQDSRADSTMRGRVVLGVGEEPDSAAVRFAFEEAAERRVPLEAVRAWRCPGYETTDHPLMTGEPARLHEERAVEILEAALRDAPEGVELHRRTAEGPARKVLLDASADAGLLVVGAQRRHGHFGLQIGRVAHTVLHHSACPVAVVPQRA
ncbi:universal stress protein [Streptomyces sp. NPDC058371]|uniref:universal stress protein n=1 Tax=Streptomyces sp. NPDC058371 TaxID=3346463 RepID=UPI003663823D